MFLTMMAMATMTTIKMTKMLTMTMMKEKMKKKRKKRKKRKANIVERNSRAPSSCRPFIYQDRIPLPQSSVWYFFVFPCIPPLYLCLVCFIFHISRPNSASCLPYYLAHCFLLHYILMHLHLFVSLYLCISVFMSNCGSMYLCIFVTYLCFEMTIFGL